MIKKDYTQTIKYLPHLGDIIEAKVLEIGRNAIYLDINGIAIGIIRGPELLDISGKFSNLKKGDKVTAMVIDEENEKGLIELSFKQASEKNFWEKIPKIVSNQELIPVKIIAANKGGLIVQYGRIQGFLPSSQLSSQHYPRVDGGNKNKILEKLKSYIGKSFKVKVIGADEKEEKLIVSEKDIFPQKNAANLKKYKVGDIINGTITGLVDFGAFVTFNKNYKGLIHISELAWQRLDNPSDVVKIGDKVRAKVIGITDDGKISLSIKQLIADPWKNVNKKYKVNQIVEGKVLKINPFGLFIELDPDIHGLAHTSELSDEPIKDITKFAKVGDKLKFKIVSIEKDSHRLGLSIKAMHHKPKNATLKTKKGS